MDLRELRECRRTYLLLQIQISKKEREISEFEMDFKKSFLLLYNDAIIL